MKRHPGPLSTSACRSLAAAALAAVIGACSPTATPPTVVPLAERVIAVLEMPGDPDWLIPGFGSMWVKRDDGNVVRMDPATDDVVAIIDADVTNPGLCQGIGADDTSIWACSGPNIVRIDPATNEVSDVVEAHKVYIQGRLVHESGRIWILNGADAELLVGVDTETLEIGPPIALDAPCADLAVGDGAIWAICPRASLVLRIDPATRTVTDRIDVPDATQISVGADAAWVVGSEGIVRIDLGDKSLTTVAVATVVETGVWSNLDVVALWAGAASVWVRTRNPFLFRIDAATSRIVETITAPEHGPGDIVGLGGTLWASDYTSGDGAVVHLRADAR